MASIMAFLILAATVLVSSSGGQDRVEPIDDVRVLNCNAIAFCLAGGGRCLASEFRMKEWDRIAREYCGPELEFADDFNRVVYYGEAAVHMAGRKLLNRLSGKQLSEEKVKDLGSATPHMVLAVPGMFLLSCLVICPCIRAKRKEQMEQKGLAKEQNSSDSISPLSGFASAERNMTPPRSVPQSPTRFPFLQDKNRVGSLQLSINQIIKATQNFSPSLKLGEGGFGTVYKGVLDDGQVVAIKRAKTEHFATLRDEFMTEVKLLAKIDHRSLVRLIGYTDKGNERIIITEYVTNGTLREHLDGIYGHILDFNQRLEIAIDVAHALTYLHMYAEKPIIHRDVKASNILLTENFRAKVSDFGFARAGPTEAGQTHISTQIKGTAGYLDPEYLRTFQLTLKSDVFSFGILLIELLSARRPVDMKRSFEERITVRWAFAKFNEGNVDEVLDPNLREDVNIEVLTKMLRLAFHCAAPTRLNRPSMKEVGEQLWEIRKDFVKSLRAE